MRCQRIGYGGVDENSAEEQATGRGEAIQPVAQGRRKAVQASPLGPGASALVAAFSPAANSSLRWIASKTSIISFLCFGWFAPSRWAQSGFCSSSLLCPSSVDSIFSICFRRSWMVSPLVRDSSWKGVRCLIVEQIYRI